MIDETIARVKTLIEQREKIDAELVVLFSMAEQPKRGRPRKEQRNGAAADAGEKPAPELEAPSAPSTDGA